MLGLMVSLAILSGSVIAGAGFEVGRDAYRRVREYFWLRKVRRDEAEWEAPLEWEEYEAAFDEDASPLEEENV